MADGTHLISSCNLFHCSNPQGCIEPVFEGLIGLPPGLPSGPFIVQRLCRFAFVCLFLPFTPSSGCLALSRWGDYFPAILSVPASVILCLSMSPFVSLTYHLSSVSFIVVLNSPLQWCLCPAHVELVDDTSCAREECGLQIAPILSFARPCRPQPCCRG